MKAERIQLITLRGQEKMERYAPAEGPRETWRLQLEGWARGGEFVFSQLDRAERQRSARSSWERRTQDGSGCEVHLTADSVTLLACSLSSLHLWR